ncbi:hypothetical protein LIER_02891 [Lithospermum erythrorhizon]|uniref:Uncharacterized protein n=1 Tax=Lithospermum erythrorhizon TaxID=34254 RepID=A0AAV3NR75_LITER
METKYASTQFVGSDSEYDVVEGLSTWELIDPYHDDDDEYDVVSAEIFSTFSDTHYDNHDVDDVEASHDVIGADPSGIESSKYLVSHESQVAWSELKSTNTLLGYQYPPESQLDNNTSDSDDEKGYTFESEHKEDEDDLDDELVPMYLKGKFDRERMKKVRRKSCARMNKLKKLDFKYNRPGCAR